jgi:hypothetical protein
LDAPSEFGSPGADGRSGIDAEKAKTSLLGDKMEKTFIQMMQVI